MEQGFGDCMNVMKLNELLSGNEDRIYIILESLGFDNIIKKHGAKEDYFVFANLDGDNKTAINVYINSLNNNNYTRMVKNGNLYTLVMDVKNINFPSALDYVTKVLKLNKEDLEQTIRYPFGGFYKNLIRDSLEPEYSMKTYDTSILEEYANKYSRLFFEDGISYDSQHSYGVGYDICSKRITIPEYTLDGKLCGIMGRLNDKECAHEDRWLPIIPCSRPLTLYGYINNYKDIKQKDLCVILESEKAPMQLSSFRCNVGLATCGDDISDIQAKYIKGLTTSKIIVAYDEGLEEEKVRSQAEKLVVKNHLYKNKVGYIYDRNHEIMKKGSKCSPSDLGKKGFSELIKKHTIWI